jgi:hypothetical protein
VDAVVITDLDLAEQRAQLEKQFDQVTRAARALRAECDRKTDALRVLLAQVDNLLELDSGNAPFDKLCHLVKAACEMALR